MKYVLILILISTVGCASKPQTEQQHVVVSENNKKWQDIKKMIHNSGELDHLYQITVKSFIEPIEQSLNEEIQNHPQKRELWKSRVEKFVYKKIYENTSFMEKLVKIYDKYYTHEEVIAILQFQDSPAGKKVRQSKNFIFQEAFHVGQIWGQRLMEEFEKDIRETPLHIAEK